jgi:hypothetical protein
MAKSLSLEDAIVATATQKAEAAQTRAHPDPDSEKPRDVILAACAAMADALQPEGFAFRKSGPGLKRVQGDLIFEIWFQSDRNNIAGRRAAIWIHAAVSSRTLARWRRGHPSSRIRRAGPHAGLITGAQIGNLRAPHAWMEWDFGDSSSRPGEIDDAVAAIRQIILPFFALFDDPAGNIDLLLRDALMSQPSILEYALSTLGQEAAEAAGRSYLEHDPEVRKRFGVALAAFKANGLPKHFADDGSNLAALAIAADLDLTI